jgi:NADH:ubiquinone oxidoreductase subunit 6 (subunit J)
MRVAAFLSIAVYAVALSFLTYMMLMWDNKGTRSIWEKDFTDWVIITWLFVATTIVFTSLALLATRNRNQPFFFQLVVIVFVVNSIGVLFSLQGEPILAIPQVVLGAGILCLHRARKSES